VIKWLAYIIQHPGLKTKTAPVLIGPQGCGKNIFTDQLAKIMAPYSNSNIADITDITGKFNGVLENLCLAVCNELKSDKKNKAVDTNKLKDIITEREIGIERKFQDKRTAENVTNFIFISNNFSPFKQELDDRRNLDLQCVMPENPTEYFQALGDEIKHSTFHQTLYTYLMNYEVDINYDFVHELPMTKLKQTMQQVYKGPFETFITAHFQDFVDGWDSKECKRIAERDIISKIDGDEAKQYKKNGLTLDLQKYCGGAKRQRVCGTEDRIYVYKLLPNYIQLFKPSDYNEFDDECC
jgi:putative DNA primase/helicase